MDRGHHVIEPDSDRVRTSQNTAVSVWSRAAMAAGVLVCLAVIAILVFPSASEPDGEQLLEVARAAYRDERFADAVECLDRIPDDGSPVAVTARTLAGELLLARFNRLAAAEQQFRRAISQDKNSLQAINQLVYLMHLGTRTWELIPFELSLIRGGRPTLRRMKALSLGPRLTTDAEFIRECVEVDADEPTVRLGLAAIAVSERKYLKAEEYLRIAAGIHPHAPIVEFRLGQVLLLRNAPEADLRAWHRALPPHAAEEPGIWMLRGLWAERRNESPVAIRCFWESLKRDPNLRQANYRLGQLLRAAKEPDAAEPFLDRSRRLTEYAATIEMINSRRTDRTRSMQDALVAAERAENLGLLFEACGWFDLSLQRDPTFARAQHGFARLQSKIATLELVRTIPEANPALKIDLSDYPLPDWHTAEPRPVKPTLLSPALERVTFEDRAAEAGVVFDFFVDHDNPGMYEMYELTGGGVAILDYDGDGWPDVYFTQGCHWPPQKGEVEHLDRLFRNLGNGRFEDVTKAAGLVEDRYSQGATVGDYNSDGLPDLYVANLDANRLYRNNGDGTFSDVTDATGTGGKRWTSSCAMADLNGDTWPDIYAVNYLGGPAMMTICRDETGKLHDCTPYEFPAEQDQFYLNLGDGRFEDITAEAGFAVRDGKGLGIVVADFDGSGKLGVFVANDGVPNFLFVNQASRSQRPRFSEQGLPSGVAVNANGEAEGGMGVAAGDVDGNGLTDLFVTNFSHESNSLYLQQPGNAFIDATEAAGLLEPSLPMLGFGTQFLDGELDGTLDLIVTNGHISQNADPQEAFEMEPQYFRNLGQANFVELPGKSLGRFFVEKRRGRGMARLDWNRDGLEDFVVSHLGAPAALLTNTTTPCGHYISVSLRGVESDRDAIGTIVTLTTADSMLTRQLLAGDGYQASNQRNLVFGLGEATQATDLEIHWPSGRRQSFRNLSANADYLFIEGHSSPVLQPN